MGQFEIRAKIEQGVPLHIKYCYNSALAICRIRLRDSAFGDVELIASRRAMLEILLPEPHPTVPLLV